jgi:hypothetical protein
LAFADLDISVYSAVWATARFWKQKLGFALRLKSGAIQPKSAEADYLSLLSSGFVCQGCGFNRYGDEVME